MHGLFQPAVRYRLGWPWRWRLCCPQPSLPLNAPGGLEIAPDELAAVRQRLEQEDLTVLAYRFEGDRVCKAQRLAAYTANQDVPPFFARHVPCPHSVVTAHLIDEVGQPTMAARDEILSFFVQRLVK